MFKKVLIQIWQLCKSLLNLYSFKSGPQDMPCSKKILTGLLVLGFALEVTVGSICASLSGKNYIMTLPIFVRMAIHIIILQCIELTFIKLILYFKRLPERFLQLSISLLSIQYSLIIVTILILVFLKYLISVGLINTLRTNITNPSKIIILASLVFVWIVSYFTWSSNVYINIFKQGLSIRTGKAILIFLSFYFINFFTPILLLFC